MSTPVLTIIAGANGSGKSTLTNAVREEFQDSSILDPDAVAKTLRQSVSEAGSEIEAGRHILRSVEKLLVSRQSFTVETTLSGRTYLKLADRAKKAGYTLVVIFVGTASLKINLARVEARVENGGHNVPAADQRRRWPRTLTNMKELLPKADMAVLLDNSGLPAFQIVAFGRKNAMTWNQPIPEWAARVRCKQTSPA